MKSSVSRAIKNESCFNCSRLFREGERVIAVYAPLLIGKRHWCVDTCEKNLREDQPEGSNAKA